MKGGVALLTGGWRWTPFAGRHPGEMVNEKVNVQARSHPDSIYAGAIGAALWGPTATSSRKRRPQTA